MNRSLLTFLSVAIIQIVGFSSCSKNSSSGDIELSSEANILSFVLGNVKVQGKEEVYSASTFAVNVVDEGGDRKFIYNTEPLLYNSDLTQVAVGFTANGVVSWNDTLISSGATINVSSPGILKVVSTDGTKTVSYKMRIDSYLCNPEEISAEVVSSDPKDYIKFEATTEGEETFAKTITTTSAGRKYQVAVKRYHDAATDRDLMGIYNCPSYETPTTLGSWMQLQVDTLGLPLMDNVKMVAHGYRTHAIGKNSDSKVVSFNSNNCGLVWRQDTAWVNVLDKMSADEFELFYHEEYDTKKPFYLKTKAEGTLYEVFSNELKELDRIKSAREKWFNE